ncbi:pentatricopeptide repeat-containing protein [Carex littledalei]|uniref:Pentatricopeptide repeat-containing protein n=1 Tax=Carex littledalei TaxID=544730 RepID=A0A833R927_9POAL|nr:pentatricopeptide repeat-containing protein [Carex littledalei]
MSRLCSIRPHSNAASIGISYPVVDFELIAKTIRSHAISLSIELGLSLHSHLIKVGICSDTYIANNLINMYSRFAYHSHAHNLFDEMPHKNVASWTTLISNYTRHGNAKEALRVFSNMLNHGLEVPNAHTLSIALKACALARDLEFGRFINNFIKEREIQCDTILGNTIIDMYVKCGVLSEARNFFNAFHLADTNSCNTMISGYLREGYVNEAEELFNCISPPDAVSFNTMIAGLAEIESDKALNYALLMHRRCLRFDGFTFPCVLKACGSLEFERMGRQIHCYLLKSGYGLNCHTGSALIDMYANCGNITDAIRVFEFHVNCSEEISERLPLVNSMLSGLVINRHDTLALKMVRCIHNSGIMPDFFTILNALKVCSSMEDIKLGCQGHAFIVKTGYDLDHVIGTSLLDFYAMCGRIYDALKIFKGLTCKDAMAWTCIISACVKHGSNQLAFSLFREMVTIFKIEADQYIVSCILKACSSLSWLQGGSHVHCYTIKLGFELDNIITLCLIDLYSKCGIIKDALRVFELAKTKDVACWTGMIMGCSYNGLSGKALNLFNEMMESGVRPNEITFLSLLYAFRNASLVNDACNIFENMEKNYGIRPSLEHYCCMVDVLSRAGRLDEAKNLLLNMPYNVSASMKHSLVEASLMNGGGGEFGEGFFSRDDVSGYVTLSNAYASVGLWDISANIREVMKKAGTKGAGVSWID